MIESQDIANKVTIEGVEEVSVLRSATQADTQDDAHGVGQSAEFQLLKNTSPSNLEVQRRSSFGSRHNQGRLDALASLSKMHIPDCSILIEASTDAQLDPTN